MTNEQMNKIAQKLCKIIEDKYRKPIETTANNLLGMVFQEHKEVIDIEHYIAMKECTLSILSYQIIIEGSTERPITIGHAQPFNYHKATFTNVAESGKFSNDFQKIMVRAIVKMLEDFKLMGRCAPLGASPDSIDHIDDICNLIKKRLPTMACYDVTSIKSLRDVLLENASKFQDSLDRLIVYVDQMLDNLDSKLLRTKGDEKRVLKAFGF